MAVEKWFYCYVSFQMYMNICQLQNASIKKGQNDWIHVRPTSQFDCITWCCFCFTRDNFYNRQPSLHAVCIFWKSYEMINIILVNQCKLLVPDLWKLKKYIHLSELWYKKASGYVLSLNLNVNIHLIII